MKSIYNPTYELLSLHGVPFMVAVDSYAIEKHDPYTLTDYEEEVAYVESVLVGGHEFVSLLSEDVLQDLLVAYQQQNNEL
jgi:hypothetical protein